MERKKSFADQEVDALKRERTPDCLNTGPMHIQGPEYDYYNTICIFCPFNDGCNWYNQEDEIVDILTEQSEEERDVIIREHEALLRECESCLARLEDNTMWARSAEQKHVFLVLQQLREKITEHLHVGGLS